MAKLFSGLTLVVALVAAFFAFKSKDLVDTLKTAAERQNTDLVDARAKLKKNEKELTAAKDELAAAKDELAKTKDMLVKADEKLKAAEAGLAAETAKVTAAEAQIAALKKNYDDLKVFFGDKTPDQITKEITDMQTAKKDLEAKVAEMEKQVAELKTVNDTLTAQKKETEDKIAAQSTTIKRYKIGFVEKGLTGQVLAVNAGWGFCVLSIGDKQGAAANKIMIVARNGQAIGKVKITNVEATQSVADIILSSFVRGTYVQPGDTVIYTGDDKPREETAPANAPAVTTPLVPELPRP